MKQISCSDYTTGDLSFKFPVPRFKLLVVVLVTAILSASADKIAKFLIALPTVKPPVDLPQGVPYVF